MSFQPRPNLETAGQVPSIDVSVARAILRGAHVRLIADTYGVSPRTVYRWRSQLMSIHRVTIDGWSAWFVHRRKAPPARISEWEWDKVDATRSYRARLKEAVEGARYERQRAEARAA